MTTLTLRNSNATAIVRQTKEDQPKEPVFLRAKNSTIAKIEFAIKELNGRYGENARPHTDFHKNDLFTLANPKTAKSVQDEQLKICIRVGKILWKIGEQVNEETGEVKDVYHAKMKPMDAIGYFEDQLAFFSNIENKPEKEEFHELAWRMCRPTTNRDNYIKDEQADLWIERPELKVAQ